MFTINKRAYLPDGADWAATFTSCKDEAEELPILD